MELTLTTDIENALKEQASQKGMTPEQLALDGLRKLFVFSTKRANGPSPSLADFLNGYIGVIHSSEYIEGGAQMSEDTGKKFAELIMQKRGQGLISIFIACSMGTFFRLFHK